jgi:hypothetical protein
LAEFATGRSDLATNMGLSAREHCRAVMAAGLAITFPCVRSTQLQSSMRYARLMVVRGN